MKLNRKEFLSTLALVLPGLGNKELVVQAAHFVFTGKSVLTYNDRICVIAPFKTDFKCSVYAKELYSILSSIEENEVDVSLKNDKLIVKAKKTKAKLSTMVSTEVIELVKSIGLTANMETKVLPEDFLDGLRLCSFTTSKDFSQFYLSCVFVNGDQVISSDDLRLSKYTMKGVIGGSFLIPASSVRELVRYDVKKYALSDNWAHFITDEGVYFSSRLVEYDYPDSSGYFEVEGRELVLPEELKNLVKASCVLAEGDFLTEKKIDVHIEKGLITCKAQREIGDIETQVETDYDGDAFSFSINPNFLFEILDKSITTVVCGDNRILFTAESFEHLIALFVG